MLQRARAILKEHFGYSSFKKGLVYSGGDDIVVTPFKVYF
jgi:hypothetical protein